MRSITELIERIINQRIKYLKTYTGKVVDIDDSTDSEKKDKLGMVKCLIYELGWYKNEQAVWCYPNDKNNLLCPKKDDFVRVAFMNGDPNRPYYTGIITELDDMLPSNYGDHRDQVIFESTDERLYIKYNEEDKEYIWEDEDGNKTVINQDGITEEDTNGNKREYTSDGQKWTDANNNVMEYTSSGMSWTDANNNKMEFTSSGMKFTNGSGKVLELTASELKMLGATESFVKGTTFNTWMTTFISLLNSHTHSGVQSGSGTSGSPSSAFTPPSNYLSTSIKGE